jgi:hypothetical protein
LPGNDLPGIDLDIDLMRDTLVTMGFESAEPRGYLSVTQTPDGVIHLIASALHYELNKAWVEARMPGR